ncbi:hypothetical protein JCM3765_006880, partial [Sporobolomyces pararoseus]
MSQSLPSALAVLPLPHNTVLFPNHLLSIQLQSRHAIALVRSVVNDAASSSTSGFSKLVIACVPLKPNDPTVDEAQRLFPGVEPKDSKGKLEGGDTSATSSSEIRKSKLQVINLPSDQDGTGVVGTLADGRPLPEELYEYGTAARIVRLEKLSTGGFLAVLEGLARISIDPSSYPTPAALSPFYTAQVSLLPPTKPLPTSHAPLITRLRELSISILSILPGSSTPLVPLFDRKLRLQLSRLSASSILSFLDSLFYSLPSTSSTTITHYDKCQVLSIPS